MVNTMKTTAVFEKEEYEKLIETLDLQNNAPEAPEGIDNYFNAWHFGQSEEDCKYIICSSLS